MFNLIEFICNKNFEGNIITPEKFKELIPVVVIDLFRKKYGLPEGYRPGSPIPSESIDITIKNTDDMKAFKEPLFGRAVVNGILQYPSGYAHRDTFVYNYTKTINGVVTPLPRPVEVLRDAEFGARQGNYTKQPTLQNPICTLRSDGVHVRPLTITSLDMFYYRWPVAPVFAYTIADGYFVYDPANSTETDWVVDEHMTLVRMCLELIGVNLRESEIVAYANTKLKEG